MILSQEKNIYNTYTHTQTQTQTSNDWKYQSKNFIAFTHTYESIWYLFKLDSLISVVNYRQYIRIFSNL